MSQEAAVLFANEAFYLAFALKDLKGMDELWSRHLPVSCIHPGWQPLFGREAVMDSWIGLFGNPASPAIECRQPRVLLYGDFAQVYCYELIEEGTLVASNLFALDARGWKLIHHQASPVAEKPQFDDPPPQRGRLQ
ncbi:hypothetical protein GCM10017083_39180 [Thalassobaculum fulvum]|jgi:hypothetical protein|uniref:SnoaL-like domain-containing protein n=1 Tax=Thalassobaculum fulvum TaxID=1633335 RepID=A0A919CSE1_9PROT|nr:nuclear transport factor 2 family protein [Thalassobaculum fulvum]GHD57524.1 hypothetical protein GCM10017083_39180 [Thalassobaculum fulvum]